MSQDERVPTGRSTTELRVLISEDALGNLDVEWEARIKNTELAVPMRPSHVAGQLFSASFIVLGKSYKGFRDKLIDATNLTSTESNSEGGKASGKKSSKVSSSR